MMMMIVIINDEIQAEIEKITYIYRYRESVWLPMVPPLTLKTY